MTPDYYMQGASFVPDGPWWAWVILLALIALAILTIITILGFAKSGATDDRDHGRSEYEAAAHKWGRAGGDDQ